MSRNTLFDPNFYAHRGQTSSAPLTPTMGRLFDPNMFNRPKPIADPAQRPAMASPQMKMFMTPREIHEGWSPLDGDREDSWGGDGTYEGTYSPKSWETGHTWDTGVGTTQANRRNYGTHSGPGGGDSGTIRRDRRGGKVRLYDRGQEGGTEDDEQLWARKLDEAQEYGAHGQHEDKGSDPLYAGGGGGRTMGSYEGYPTQRTGHSNSEPSDSAWDRHYEREAAWNQRREDQHGNYGQSLYDSIREEGVKGPIRLGQEIGSMGKPQIVGGHHRLAAATEAAPNRLVPVLHDKNIWSARDQASKGGYPYS
jgi:hypothetical protein